MADTITYTFGETGATRSFTISDTMVAVLDAFRASFGKNPDGTDMFPTIPDMLKARLNESTVSPAVRAFPTQVVQTKLAAVQAAQMDLVSTIQAEIDGTIAG